MPDKDPRLLVVDDLEAEMIARTLQVKGYQVEMAMSAAEALAMIVPGRYTLFLLDGAMPVMDGFTLARRLRKQGYGEPIIFVTAYMDDMTGPHARFVGNAEVVRKPIEPAALFAAVEAALRPKVEVMTVPASNEVH
jgi:DNA-binding response OmpR family regulator